MQGTTTAPTEYSVCEQFKPRVDEICSLAFSLAAPFICKLQSMHLKFLIIVWSWQSGDPISECIRFVEIAVLLMLRAGRDECSHTVAAWLGGGAQQQYLRCLSERLHTYWGRRTFGANISNLTLKNWNQRRKNDKEYNKWTKNRSTRNREQKKYADNKNQSFLWIANTKTLLRAPHEPNKSN